MISPLYVLLLWAAASPLLFVFFSVRRAVMVSFVFGWLFLPKASVPIAGFPDISANMVIAMGVIFGTLVFDFTVLLRFRPRFVDLFAIALLIVPIFTSLSNDLGIYDGVSRSFGQFVKWGVPYFFGRVLIRSLDDLRDFVLILLVGALVYLPFCAWEMRMSPHLNKYLYGFEPFRFYTTRRFGGWRPVVFLSHGIEMGMWLMSAAIVAIAAWRSRQIKAIGGVPMSWIAIVLLAFLLLSRALGGWALFVVAMGCFATIRIVKFRPILLLFVLLPAIYVGMRVLDVWNGAGLVDAVTVISEKRAGSLQTRLIHDQRLKDRALERPILGWGGWGRQRLRSAGGANLSITDAMWVIMIGQHGLIGLVSWVGMFVVPCVMVVRSVNIRHLISKPMLPVLALVLIVPMLMTDLMLNAFIGPILIMIPGALVSLASALAKMAQASDVASKRARAAAARAVPAVPGRAV